MPSKSRSSVTRVDPSEIACAAMSRPFAPNGPALAFSARAHLPVRHVGWGLEREDGNSAEDRLQL
jgi:hypothetical protein